jgi:hypothetical protein
MTKNKKGSIAVDTIKILEEKKLLTNDIVKWLKEDKSSSIPLLKTKEEITPSEKQYSKYRIKDGPDLKSNNIEYFVSRNWGIGNIDKFITKIKTKFPKFTYDLVG